MSSHQLDHPTLQGLLERKVAEVIAEPAFNWRSDFRPFMTDSDGAPVVRLGVTNCRIDMDIWEGLRGPANVGMYPLDLSDIWKHFAAADLQGTRPDGTDAPLVMPEAFEDACRRFRRAVIVSGMLVLNPEIFEAYKEKIETGDPDPIDYYSRATDDVLRIVEKALSKMALGLMAADRAVVPMVGKKVGQIIERTRAEYLKGRYHGPCNEHWPRNSIAVMTGLLRFGANRLPFRDEVTAGNKRQRLFGRYASLVAFDGADPVDDAGAGVSLLDSERLAWMRRIADYTDTDPEVMAERYCTYNKVGSDGTTVCGACLDGCPSGALANSTPLPAGGFEPRVVAQEHRFWKQTLDFDHANCCRDRIQKQMLFDEYVCIRCEALCAASGVKRSRSELRAINGG